MLTSSGINDAKSTLRIFDNFSASIRVCHVRLQDSYDLLMVNVLNQPSSAQCALIVVIEGDMYWYNEGHT